jgi:hypothetical protein
VLSSSILRPLAAAKFVIATNILGMAATKPTTGLVMPLSKLSVSTHCVSQQGLNCSCMGWKCMLCCELTPTWLNGVVSQKQPWEGAVANRLSDG